MAIEDIKNRIRDGYRELEEGRVKFVAAYKEGGGKEKLNPPYQIICKSIKKVSDALQEYEKEIESNSKR